jgi:hypothetical protein
MTQENKELLLKDLSARLLYGVKGIITYNDNKDVFTLNGIINRTTLQLSDNEFCNIEDFKPYLRPMYSMTNEERSERIGLLWEFEGHINEDVTYKYQDWLNAHHLDYRFLIPMGLAIEVTKENNPYE